MWNRFRQNFIINQLTSDLKSLDEVLLEKRIEIFKEKVTPEFAKIGLTNWNGKYLWYSNFNEDGVKHVVEYHVFKFYSGSFTYGNCYYSVPTISGGKKLINHRTVKSTKIHFFKRLDGWQESMAKNSRSNRDIINTMNEAKFRTSIDDVLLRNLPKMKKWFDDTKSINQNIEILKKEIENPPYDIGFRSVSFEYVLSFLYKQQNNLQLSTYWINEHFKKELNSERKKIYC